MATYCNYTLKLVFSIDPIDTTPSVTSIIINGQTYTVGVDGDTSVPNPIPVYPDTNEYLKQWLDSLIDKSGASDPAESLGTWYVTIEPGCVTIQKLQFDQSIQRLTIASGTTFTFEIYDKADSAQPIDDVTYTLERFNTAGILSNDTFERILLAAKSGNNSFDSYALGTQPSIDIIRFSHTKDTNLFAGGGISNPSAFAQYTDEAFNDISFFGSKDGSGDMYYAAYPTGIGNTYNKVVVAHTNYDFNSSDNTIVGDSSGCTMQLPSADSCRYIQYTYDNRVGGVVFLPGQVVWINNTGGKVWTIILDQDTGAGTGIVLAYGTDDASVAPPIDNDLVSFNTVAHGSNPQDHQLSSDSVREFTAFIPTNEIFIQDGETFNGGLVQETTGGYYPVDDTVLNPLSANFNGNTFNAAGNGSDGPETHIRIIHASPYFYMVCPNKIECIHESLYLSGTDNYWLSASAPGTYNQQISALSGGTKSLSDLAYSTDVKKLYVATNDSVVALNILAGPMWTLHAEFTPAGTKSVIDVDVVLDAYAPGNAGFVIAADSTNNQVMKLDYDLNLIKADFITATGVSAIGVYEQYIAVACNETDTKLKLYNSEGVLIKKFTTAEVTNPLEVIKSCTWGVQNVLFYGSQASATQDALVAAKLQPLESTDDLDFTETDCFTNIENPQEYCDHYASIGSAEPGDLLYGVVIDGVLYTPPTQYSLTDEPNIEAWLNSLTIPNAADIQYDAQGNPTIVQLFTQNNWGYFAYVDVNDNNNVVYVPFERQNCTVPVFGCTDIAASNYNPLATIDDGSCFYDPNDPNRGCTDPQAINYSSTAIYDDGTCKYPPVTIETILTCCGATKVYQSAKAHLLGEDVPCCDELRLDAILFGIEIIKGYVNPGTIYRKGVEGTYGVDETEVDVTMDEADLCFDFATKDALEEQLLEICYDCCDGANTDKTFDDTVN